MGRPAVSVKVKEEENNSVDTNINVLSARKRKPRMSIKRDDLHKHRKNIKQVLLCSNATPIRRNGDMGYMCCFCKEQYRDPANLKQHTLDYHKDIENAFFMNVTMERFAVKLDITCLKCPHEESTLKVSSAVKTEEIGADGRKVNSTSKQNVLVPVDRQEIFKHRINITNILLSSNATPIRRYEDMGYMCCYCIDQYRDPADLKIHTLECHQDVQQAYFMKLGMEAFVVRLDITSLRCTICNASMETLEKLVEHLNSDHEIEIFTDVKSHITPFKFITETLQCCICTHTFSKFKSLLEHMNIHYRNYICKQCDGGFTVIASLRAHMHVHESGNFKCEHCLKVFETASKKRAHERAKHVHKLDVYKCGYCNETFSDHRSKEEHLVSIHGLKMPISKCLACNKVFSNRQALRVHVKRDHLLERRHNCPDCDMSFFNANALQRHIIKHTKLRTYKCAVCSKGGHPVVTIKVERDHEPDNPKDKETVSTATKTSHMPLKIKDIFKHRTNIKEVMRWSNATPIRRVGDKGYVCCYCNDQYLEPEGLKKHTLENHNDVRKAFFIKHLSKDRFIVKLDITSLRCNICDQNIDSLDKFLKHLKIDHTKTIYTDVKNHIVPFKFTTETLQCCICTSYFDKFRMLLEHMNTHYRNYVCDVCDVGFVNSSGLQTHITVHNTGIFKCGYCARIFDKLSKKKTHERTTHSLKPNFRKCAYCNESFSDFRLKEAHLIEMHGLKVRTPECQACEKVFKSRKSLSLHIRRDHLMERQHKCPECDKSFFESATLKIHMIKHTGVRSFKCNICSKAFSRPNVLRQHMNIHDETRMFKCVQCEKPFAQNCAWKSHMKIKHGSRVTVKAKIQRNQPDEVEQKTVTRKTRQTPIMPLKTKSLPKHRANIKEVMLSSNATPIRRFGDMGFMCCYCDDQYLEPAELKQHTLETHPDIRKAFFITKLGKDRFVVKLDITALRCKICDRNIDTLEQLMHHLRVDHHRTIYTDIKNHIIPFKFITDTLQCCICMNTFSKFKMLLEHMNIHYRNYICDICDVGFVNAVNLTNHMLTHENGTFKCDHCSQVFNTKNKKRLHERKHGFKTLLFKCGHCSATFNEYRKKEAHLALEHGQAYKCQACTQADTVNVFTEENRSDNTESIKLTLLPINEGINKHRTNIKEVMRWSNATPIRRYGDMGYTCCYCKEQYLNPADLKAHTLENHKDIQKAFFMKYRMDRFVVRLDITALECTICNQYIDTIEELLEHLKSQHRRPIYTDIKNHIIPFKFVTDKLQCCICVNTFSKFKMLIEHMNIHYRNYICQICDVGFVNSMNFSSHKLIHSTGTFKCDYCPQILDTKLKKKSHERAIHSPKAPSLHKCGYCIETFSEYRKKEAHLVLMHGLKIPTVKCEACEKIFKNRQSLSVHVKRDHLLDRRHKCPECSKAFFSTGYLKDHMIKHSGSQAQFNCNVCSKVFSRKKNLKEHKKIHDDVRQFKCEHCGRAFVQKCSWKSHMRAKHAEIV
ncbi:unnamed protein product [Arctia plantaginis]|uniref:C2H2-type domain-containing protein n=1 Tax=Arctia plantaginis TaxID=874455 RepID=A0A8S1BXY6_ARCPL|nr:unnamed protein product [Arctia plantaginis]